MNNTFDFTKLEVKEQMKKVMETIENNPDMDEFHVINQMTGEIMVIKRKTAWEKEVERRQAEAAAKREAEIAQMRMARKNRLAKQKAKAVARMNKKN